MGASNPQNSISTTIDTTRLANAETDVQAVLQTIIGVAYSDTDASIVAYAVDGVVLRLLVLTGQADISSWESWKRAVKDELAPTEGRDRIVPTTNSNLKWTPDQPLETPQMDRSVFDRFFIPRSPASNPAGARDYLSNS